MNGARARARAITNKAYAYVCSAPARTNFLSATFKVVWARNPIQPAGCPIADLISISLANKPFV